MSVSGQTCRDLALAAIVASAAACTQIRIEGPDEQGYRWMLVGDPIEPRVHEVNDGNIVLRCGLERESQACAVRRGDVCDIYVPDDAPPWLIEHEKRHCAGWRHPDWTRSPPF